MLEGGFGRLVQEHTQVKRPRFVLAVAQLPRYWDAAQGKQFS
jgi:hypothetical protein